MRAMSILPGLVALGLIVSSGPTAAQNATSSTLRHVDAQTRADKPAAVGETQAVEKQERSSAKRHEKKRDGSHVMKTKHDTAKASINNVR